MTLLSMRQYLTLKAGIAGNPLFPAARLNQIINFARKFVQLNLNGLGYKRWETAYPLTLGTTTFGSIGAVYGLIPPDMLESPASIILIQTSDGTTKAITRNEFSPTQFENSCSNSFEAPTAKDPAYMRLAGTIYLYPSTLVSAILFYYAALADLINDVDDSAIPAEFEEFVILKALTEIQSDLSPAYDKAKGEANVIAQLGNAYQKYLGSVGQKQTQNKQQEQEVIE